jgi:stringent starvation protein B
VRVPDKKQTLISYLRRGVAMVHLDARRPGVVVPQRYIGDAHLRLNLSFRYAIPDFDIDDRRIQATLSFSGQPFQCILPWEAVFGITSSASGDGQVWPEDLPVEVVQTLASGVDERGARLAAVKEEPAQEEARAKPPDGSPRPHLRLVR